METFIEEISKIKQKEVVDLRSFVNDLVATNATNVKGNPVIINDIPASMELAANADMIAAVLSNLFYTLSKRADVNSVRLTAKQFSNVILLKLQDSNRLNNILIKNALQLAKPIAEKMGGFLGITSLRKNESTIVFSFPNRPLEILN